MEKLSRANPRRSDSDRLGLCTTMGGAVFQSRLASALHTASTVLQVASHHKMVVFGNVNSSDFILNYHALIQANDDMHILGQSSTGMYAYRVWLWRVPIVLTVDSQAAWDRENPWISENCFEVNFEEPCYTLAD